MESKSINESNSEITFSKDQILKSRKYSNRKDVINALLEETTQYSVEDVDKIIDDFMKGKVV